MVLCFQVLFISHNSPPQWAMASSFTRFLDHTQQRTTVGRTPLDEWSARRRDPYLTTHNIHIRQTSMPPVGFEPTISAGEQPQTYALDRAATGTGVYRFISRIFRHRHSVLSAKCFSETWSSGMGDLSYSGLRYSSPATVRMCWSAWTSEHRPRITSNNNQQQLLVSEPS